VPAAGALPCADPAGGREQEVAAVEAMVRGEGSGWSTLTGPGGWEEPVRGRAAQVEAAGTARAAFRTGAVHRDASVPVRRLYRARSPPGRG